LFIFAKMKLPFLNEILRENLIASVVNYDYVCKIFQVCSNLLVKKSILL
jgi:hypothetical protein